MARVILPMTSRMFGGSNITGVTAPAQFGENLPKTLGITGQKGFGWGGELHFQMFIKPLFGVTGIEGQKANVTATVIQMSTKKVIGVESTDWLIGDPSKHGFTVAPLFIVDVKQMLINKGIDPITALGQDIEFSTNRPQFKFIINATDPKGGIGLIEFTLQDTSAWTEFKITVDDPMITGDDVKSIFFTVDFFNGTLPDGTSSLSVDDYNRLVALSATTNEWTVIFHEKLANEPVSTYDNLIRNIDLFLAQLNEPPDVGNGDEPTDDIIDEPSTIIQSVAFSIDFTNSNINSFTANISPNDYTRLQTLALTNPDPRWSIRFFDNLSIAPSSTYQQVIDGINHLLKSVDEPIIDEPIIDEPEPPTPPDLEFITLDAITISPSLAIENNRIAGGINLIINSKFPTQFLEKNLLLIMQVRRLDSLQVIDTKTNDLWFSQTERDEFININEDAFNLSEIEITLHVTQFDGVSKTYNLGKKRIIISTTKPPIDVDDKDGGFPLLSGLAGISFAALLLSQLGKGK